MIWLWTGVGLLFAVPLGILVMLVVLYFYLRIRYFHYILRIFQEKPLFIVPRGQPIPGAEDVTFPTSNGLQLRGCYVRGAAPRRGVILFGLEFGSNRWSCLPYCERLLENGYDIFAYEPRNQGESDSQPGYEPLQWVTSYETEDAKAALAYLKQRPDADPRGVGFFGISKGGGAGVMAAAKDPAVRCLATDGIFASYTTLLPYMKKFYTIYNSQYILQGLVPMWYYGIIGMDALGVLQRQRKCRFAHMERVMSRLRRPLFMIHGGGDTYIKPEMAEALFKRAREPKQFWLVDGAKHNQALHIARDEYQRRVLEFFNTHLADPSVPPPAPATTPALVAPELAKAP